MFGFKKKNFRVFEVPQEDLLEVIELMDAFFGSTASNANITKYRLWTKLEDLFPEVRDKSSDWHVHVYRSTNVQVREGLSTEWPKD